MAADAPVLSPADLEHFADRGYVRVGGAFTSVQAAAMRDVVWEALARHGVLRDDPSTCTVEAPSHLQHLKRHPVFAAVGSERTIAAIDQLLGAGQWRRPADWGAFFLMFPTPRAWNVACRSWHVDHDYLDRQVRLSELKVHALFGAIEPRAGGMHVLAGSQHVVAGYFARHPAGTRFVRRPPAKIADGEPTKISTTGAPQRQERCQVPADLSRASVRERVGESEGRGPSGPTNQSR